jgi:hypothetical protein
MIPHMLVIIKTGGKVTAVWSTHISQRHFCCFAYFIGLMFIYCRYRSTVVKLITLHRSINYLFLYFVKSIPYQKTVPICYVPYACIMSCFFRKLEVLFDFNEK